VASVSEFVAARLRAWGVDRVFGLPGPDVDALVTALGSGAGHPGFVQARHEESAALMACAHAKLTGRAGCCLAPSGAGALHLLSGLYDAMLDRQPVVAVVGEDAPPHGREGRRGAVGTVDLFARVSEFSEVVSEPRLVGDALDRAFRAALTDRGVATVVVPRSVLEAEAPANLSQDRAASAAAGFRPPVRRPREEELRRAAEALNAGRRVAVVVGRDGAGASGQVAGVAGLLGAGVAKTPLARDVLPDDLPHVTGVAAPFGSTAAAALLRDCDTLLLVGAGDLDHRLVPRGDRTRVVAVGTDGLPEPPDVEVDGDAAAALDALLPLLRRKQDRGWRKDVERAVEDWRADGRAKANRFFGHAVNPRSVVAALSERLPDRAVVITDSGTAVDWWTRHLRLRNGMRATLSDGLATPGAAVPYAVAARLAFPDRPVVALVGDGAFQSSGLNELITVKRHLARFRDQPPLVFCVLNNRDTSRLTWRRRTAAGNPRIPPSDEVPDLPYAEFARLLGLGGVRCDSPGRVGGVWDDALAAAGPVVLEFVVDAETPPDWADDALRRGGKRPPRGVGRRSLRRRVTAAVGGYLGLTRSGS
jgi:pyruvate dehydrogenase (quinone)